MPSADNISSSIQLLCLFQGDGTWQNTEPTIEEAKKTSEAMTEAPKTSKYNMLEKCAPDRSTAKISINVHIGSVQTAMTIATV